MSSIQSVVMSLLSGVDDPEIRMEVMRTIYFLFQVYKTGRVADEAILNDLFDICYRVIRAKHPDLTKEEATERARRMAEELLESFRLQTMFSRTTARFSRM